MDALVRHDTTPALLAAANDNRSKLYRFGRGVPHPAEEAGETSQARDAAVRLSQPGAATNGFPAVFCAHHVRRRLPLKSAAFKHNRDALAAACRGASGRKVLGLVMERLAVALIATVI
jgi:hypothetical protein